MKGAFFRRLGAIAKKETYHVARDPLALAVAFGMPFVLILLFGFAVSFDLEDLPFAVVDQDGTPASRRLVESFTATSVFRVRAVAREPAEVEALFRRGVVKMALVIPPGYQREVLRSGSPRAQLLVDGADSTTAQTALAYAAGVAQAETQRRLQLDVGRLEVPLTAKVKAFFNPELRSAVFIVPGVIAMVLTTVATMLTALTIAREWERGNVEQLFATPVGRLEVIIGKIVPYLVMGMLQVLLLLAVGATIFDVPIRGNLFVLGAATLLFLAAMLAQGVFLGVVTKHQQVATQLSVLTTLIPSTLLSGFIFPIDNMPPPLQVVSALLPARYFIDALRSVLLKGGGVAEVWTHFLAMGGFALLMTLLAARKFQRRLG